MKKYINTVGIRGGYCSERTVIPFCASEEGTSERGCF